MKELVTSIARQAEAELEKADAIYPEFSSPHEAYAVIKERIEKTRNELDTAKVFLWEYWNDIKNNTSDKDHVWLTSLYNHAFYCAAEALVLAAIAQKAIDGYPELCFFNVKLKDDIAQTPQPPKIEVQKPDDMPPNDNPFLDEPYEIF